MRKKIWVLLFVIVFVFIAFSSQSEKPVLAILNLEEKNISKDDATILTSFLQESIFKTGKYDLVERTQIESIMKEYEIQYSGISRLEYAVKMGNQLNANKILMGNVGKIGESFIVQLKLVDIESAKIENMDSIIVKCSIEDLPVHLNTLASSLVGSPRQAPPDKLTEKHAGVRTIQPEKAYENEDGYWEKDFGYGHIMVYIPEGEFLMGSNMGDEYNRPAHKVYLDGYWIDKYEVSNEQFKKFADDTNWKMNSKLGLGITNIKYKFAIKRKKYMANEPQSAAIGIIWEDAHKYCEWVSNEVGLKLTLPTEAEWEKAARGTDGRYFPWGNGQPQKNMSYYGQHGGYVIYPQKVNSFREGRSPYGVFNLAGNIAEYCQDWMGKDYYMNSSYKNPMGPENSTNKKYKDKIIKGGHFYTKGDKLQVWRRGLVSLNEFSQVSSDSLRARISGHWCYRRGFRCVLRQKVN